MKRSKIETTPQDTAVRSGRIADAIARSRPEDYDGHTEFYRMTPTQRLEWLDYAVTFIEMVNPRVRAFGGSRELSD